MLLFAIKDYKVSRDRRFVYCLLHKCHNRTSH